MARRKPKRQKGKHHKRKKSWHHGRMEHLRWVRAIEKLRGGGKGAGAER